MGEPVQLTKEDRRIARRVVAKMEGKPDPDAALVAFAAFTIAAKATGVSIQDFARSMRTLTESAGPQ